MAPGSGQTDYLTGQYAQAAEGLADQARRASHGRGRADAPHSIGLASRTGLPQKVSRLADAPGGREAWPPRARSRPAALAGLEEETENVFGPAPRDRAVLRQPERQPAGR